MADANCTPFVCRLCSEAKPITDFYLRETGKPRSECKACSIALNVERRGLHKTRGAPIAPPVVKRCSVCQETKPAAEFHKRKDTRDYLSNSCKSCKSIAGKKLREDRANRPESIGQIAFKCCSTCGQVKPVSEFFKSIRSRDRLQGKCKICDLSAQRARCEAKPEEVRSTRKAWRTANPEKVRQQCHARRARILNASGTYTADDIKRLHELQRGRCACCRIKLTEYHIDHIMPLARGGSNDKLNLQLLCPPCNQRKQAKDPFKHANDLGRLL